MSEGWPGDSYFVSIDVLWTIDMLGACLTPVDLTQNCIDFDARGKITLEVVLRRGRTVQECKKKELPCQILWKTNWVLVL